MAEYSRQDEFSGYRPNLSNKVDGVWFGLQFTSVTDGTSNIVEEPVFKLCFSDAERLSAAPNNKTGQDLNSFFPRNIFIQFGHLPPARPFHNI